MTLRAFAVFVAGWLLLGACTQSGPRDPLGEGRDGSVGDGTSHADGGLDGKPVNGLCDGIQCRAPAVCNTDGKPHCVCPDGYLDTKHDGSQCDARDECADAAKSGCDKHAVCTATAGSHTCSCPAPAYVGDGKKCECAQGYSRDSEGLCLANDGHKCGDNLDCFNSHCEGGTCCAHSCGNPGECHTNLGATCEDGTTCIYPLVDDGTPCDDAKACTATSDCRQGVCTSGAQPTDCDDHNPCTDDSCEEPIGCKNHNNTLACDDKNACTSGEHCQTGSCQGGTVKDCSGQSDACNIGKCSPSSGTCSKVARSGSPMCNDASSCTPNDQCVAGECMGSGNACGPNALMCMPASPNHCTCPSGYVDNQAGSCVPTSNECANASVCSPHADCFDPSNAPGNVICSCRFGYVGNGTICDAIDGCQGNPCGANRGTCVAGTPGNHTCACNAGYVSSGGTCVCDMTGTFVTRVTMDVSWDAQGQIEAGSGTTYSYSIQRHMYDEQNNLNLEITACGDTALDICGLGVAPLLAAEAYSQFLPVGIWDSPNLPVIKTRVVLFNPQPGSVFATDDVVALFGISLADPKGLWPPSRRDIIGPSGFDGTAVNGATWLDHDNDGKIGITSYAVPPGGILVDGIAPDPITDFGELSPDCPRNGGTHTKYQYFPAPPVNGTLTPVRMKRFYTASRVISSYVGTINSCDEISGDVIGPANGQMLLEGRTGGCLRTNGSGEVDCESSSIDFLDSTQPNNPLIKDAKFKTRRVSDNITCPMVRAMSFD